MSQYLHDLFYKSFRLYEKYNFHLDPKDGTTTLNPLNNQTEKSAEQLKTKANYYLGMLGGLVYYGPNANVLKIPFTMFFQRNLEDIGAKISERMPSCDRFKYVARAITAPLLVGTLAVAYNRFGKPVNHILGENFDPMDVAAQTLVNGLLIPVAANIAASGIKVLSQVADAEIIRHDIVDNLKTEDQDQPVPEKTKKGSCCLSRICCCFSRCCKKKVHSQPSVSSEPQNTQKPTEQPASANPPEIDALWDIFSDRNHTLVGYFEEIRSKFELFKEGPKKNDPNMPSNPKEYSEERLRNLHLNIRRKWLGDLDKKYKDIQDKNPSPAIRQRQKEALNYVMAMEAYFEQQKEFFISYFQTGPKPADYNELLSVLASAKTKIQNLFPEPEAAEAQEPKPESKRSTSKPENKETEPVNKTSPQVTKKPKCSCARKVCSVVGSGLCKLIGCCVSRKKKVPGATPPPSSAPAAHPDRGNSEQPTPKIADEILNECLAEFAKASASDSNERKADETVIATACVPNLPLALPPPDVGDGKRSTT